MRYFLALIVSLYGIFLSGQTESFEIIDGNGENLRGLLAFEDEEGNYILSVGDNKSDNSISCRIYKLTLDGVLTHSLELMPANISTIWYLREEANGYLGIGKTWEGSEDSSHLWVLHLSKELEVKDQSLKFVGDLNIAEFHCIPILDTILCVGSRKYPPDGFPKIPFIFKYLSEVGIFDVKTNLGFDDLLTGLLPMPGDTMYLLRGFFLRVMDQGFNLIETITPNVYFNLIQQGHLASFNTTQFLVTGKHSNHYPDTVDTRDIGIKLSDYASFEDIKLEIIGKPGDAIDHPAYFQSIDYLEKDKIYCGGTSNVHSMPSVAGTIPSWFVLAQYDSTLNKNWEHYYGGDAYYSMYGLLATSDGGCLMYGFRHDYKENYGKLELYVLKVDENGILSSSTSIPLSNTAIKVFPNPATEKVTFDLGETISKNCRLQVFDELGRLMYSKKVEEHKEDVEIQHWEAGIYFYQLIHADGKILSNGKLVKSR